MLQAAVDNMAKFGRIVLCGQIAGYNDQDVIPAFTNMTRVIYGSVRLQGFLFGDHTSAVPVALAAIIPWLRSGAIVARQDIRVGFENRPLIFYARFDGPKRGTLSGRTDENAYARHAQIGRAQNRKR